MAAVVDLLATVKAELSRPGRPIASLLFIGPTGVGKTEMAKALAEFLYQDRRRMTRIDMSEYADPAGRRPFDRRRRGRRAVDLESPRAALRRRPARRIREGPSRGCSISCFRSWAKGG